MIQTIQADHQPLAPTVDTEALVADVQRSIDANDGRFYSDTLECIPPLVAEVLSTADYVELYGVRSLPTESATYLGQTDSLCLEVVDSIFPESGRALMQGNNPSITFPVMTGHASGDAELLRGFSGGEGSLSLPGIRELSSDVLDALSGFGGELELSSLVFVDADDIDRLTRSAAILVLSCNTRFTPAAISAIERSDCSVRIMMGLDPENAPRSTSQLDFDTATRTNEAAKLKYALHMYSDFAVFLSTSGERPSKSVGPDNAGDGN